MLMIIKDDVLWENGVDGTTAGTVVFVATFNGSSKVESQSKHCKCRPFAGKAPEERMERPKYSK